MRAITQTTYGGPDRLLLTTVPRPEPGPSEVLVQVHAAGVNQGSRRLRTGDFPGITWLPGRLMMGLRGPRPLIQGTSFAGRVVAVGSEVTRFAVGERVFGSALHGAYAEFLALPEDGGLATTPDGLEDAAAASLPYGGVTSLVFLKDMGELKAGQRVCILGASGGVGRIAIQLARHLGAEVTAVCSRANHELVRGLGAQHVVDYHDEDFRDAAQPFDLILDTIGASSFGESRRALTADGRYLSLIVSARLLWDVLRTRLRPGQRACAGAAMGGAAEMQALAQLAEQGAIRPVIDRCFPLEQIAQAHAWLESGQARGSVVVSVDGQELPAEELAPVVQLRA